MSADQPGFPNYFDLLQNIAQPFFAKSSSGASPSEHAAAMAFAALDPKEIERRIAELETVLAWLKAQVGVLELSLKTLEYQKTFLEGLKPATGENTTTQPDIAEAIKSAVSNPAMNPALWAWNLLQKAQGADVAPAPAATAKKQKPANMRKKARKSAP